MASSQPLTDIREEQGTSTKANSVNDLSPDHPQHTATPAATTTPPTPSSPHHAHHNTPLNSSAHPPPVDIIDDNNTSGTGLARRPSRRSSVSHVDPDFFDPSGMKELQRTISHLSAASNKRSHNKTAINDEEKNLEPRGNTSDQQSVAAPSDATLSPEEGFDFERTLRELQEQRGEAAIKTRELGVVFDDLRVVGLGASASYQPTFGSTINPLGILEKIRLGRHPPLKDILSGFQGVIRPGEMLLVLGRPGSGCSTFLKTLANQTDEYHSVHGDRAYDSLSPAEIALHYRGDVQYCPEDDVHFPSLTVGQTISFAAKMRAPQVRVKGASRNEYVSAVTRILTTIFGLGHTLDTPVGDAAIRGVSGGEKKRVSIAEALATRSRIGAWDNSTRGLDASTALEFGRALRIATDIDHVTMVVSIYQAGETLYSLFDKVCVIYEGRMAYFGPADRARAYFEEMGWVPADRQTTPDFLVAVTDPNGRIPRPGVTNQPRTAAEFAAYFLSSPLAQQNREDIASYRESFTSKKDRRLSYKESVREEHASGVRPKSAYTISVPMQARAVMLRRVQILKGNPVGVVLNLVSFIVQGIITASVFVKIPDATSAYFSRGGVLFFALLFSALSSMAEIPALFSQRPIVQRHQKAAMYHPFIEGVALTLVDLPMTLCTSAVFGVIIYFIVGLQGSAQQFFIFYLFLFTMSVTMKAWFRSIAAAFKSEATAQAFAGILLLILVIYTGYTIPKPSMIGALRWITYINPLRYGFEAILSNEFHTLNGQCSSLVPSGPGYESATIANQVCSSVGAVAGQSTVDGNRFIALSYGYSYANLWFNFGILLVFGFGFVAVLLIFTEYNTASENDATVVLFKRGEKVTVQDDRAAVHDDVENGSPPSPSSPLELEGKRSKEQEAFKAAKPMTDVFSWQHVQYVVPVQDGERRLLDDVSGYVAPGKLTALMGESGAGKTTLLNVLAERVSTGVVMGDRFVNGQALPSDFQSQTGYCQQMDTHVPTDTVREAILFSAVMRQPGAVSFAEKQAYAEECIKMCGLENFADAVIGSLGIEQRKRTTIGVELAAKPKLLLFLDEPTSGLDSQSAWAIMSFLRDLADNGQAILCTIHQPSAELFQVFDRLLLLRKGGQTVYFGDIGQSSTTLISHFERNGARKCDESENPAEYILEAIGAGATATSAQDWHEIWLKSTESKDLQTELEKIHTEGRSRPAVEATFHSEFASSWFNQTKELLKRDGRNHWRNPTYLMAKLMLNIVAGLFIGFTFYKSKNSQQGTQNKLFAIYMATVVSAPLSNQLQVPFLKMRTVYEIRERSSRMYSWTALVTSQIFGEIPFNMVGSSIFFFCWYWTVGFPSSRAGYTFLMQAVIFPLYYTSFAQAVAAMVPSPEIAALLFSFLFSFTLTFNGVLQPFRELGWWQWMYHVSPYTYYIEGMLGQAIGKQSIQCSPTELVTLNPPSGQTCGQYLAQYISNAGGYLTNSDATSGCEFCSFSTTDQFLSASFNIQYSHRWRNIGFLAVYIVFNITAVYAATWFFRIRTGTLIGSLKKAFSKKK